MKESLGEHGWLDNCELRIEDISIRNNKSTIIPDENNKLIKQKDVENLLNVIKNNEMVHQYYVKNINRKKRVFEIPIVLTSNKKDIYLVGNPLSWNDGVAVKVRDGLLIPVLLKIKRAKSHTKSTLNKKKRALNPFGIRIAFGEAQGKRKTMEDRHFISESLGVFAIFDGHGGVEVGKSI